MATPLRVLIADDNVIVRAGLRALLDADDGFDVIAECTGLDELLEAVRRDPPDVVLTDIRMAPDQSDEGIRAAAALRDSHPAVGVVVLSQYVEAGFALALMDGGSRGRAYLLKDRIGHPGQLARVLHTVAEGGSHVDPLVVDALVAAQVRDRRSPVAILTAREQEVLGEIAAGYSNAAIAERLFVSERAVEKHVNSIFSKLGLSDDREAHRRVTAVLRWLGR